MSNQGYCAECEAICAELMTALDEIPTPPRPRDELRADFEAMRKMMMGTEELQADEVLGRFKPGAEGLGPLVRPECRTRRFNAAVRKMVHHIARTGHHPQFRRWAR